MFSIDGEHVRIRTLRTSDLEDFLLYRANPAAYRWQAFGPMNQTEARQFLRNHPSLDAAQPGQWQQLGIELSSTQQLIGDLAMRFSRVESQNVELALTISPDFHRLGIGKETMRLLLNHLFSQNIHKVFVRINEHNEGSVKLIESKGFKLEGRLREHFWNGIDNTWDDELIFGLLAEEWAARMKARR